MGKLADDMTRLSQEIRGLRADRQEFVETLKSEVATMRNEFKKEHIAMAKENRKRRQAVVDDLRAAQRAWSELGNMGPAIRNPSELDFSAELALIAEAEAKEAAQKKSEKTKTKKTARQKS